MSSHVELLADVFADALTAENLSLTTVKGVRRQSRPIIAGCLIAHGGSPPIMSGHVDRRGLVHALNALQDQSQHPRARNNYDEETVCDRDMNLEPMSWAPRQLLTCWVAHSRPVGCQQMTWGRTLENALAIKGISKEFKERIAIAKDRPNRR